MTQQEFLATAGFPDTPEGRAAFYREYDSPEKFYAKHGGSLSGAPHNGQPTADEFFSYGAPALGHMNIPMSNPTYLAHGGTYFGGPIRPYQEGGDTRTVSQMWKEVTGLPWSEAKKNGVTDGSYEANMQLRNALLKGSFTNLSDIGQAPRFRASEQEQEEEINPIAAGRTAANIMASPTPQSLLVPKKSNNKVKATQVDKAITKTTKKAPPAKHIDAGAFQVVDNITGVTADYFKNSPLPGVVNTPKMQAPVKKGGVATKLNKGPVDKRKIPQSGLVVDKRTNQAYYFGDKGEKGSFPVLTGANVDLNYNPYELEELEKHPELRNTPTGYYLMGTAFKDDPSDREYKGQFRRLMPISAYNTAAPIASAPNTDLGLHTSYSSNRNNPFDKEFLRREGLYNKVDPAWRNTSFGCVNCQEENYNTLRNVFPGRDTALVLDSKRAADLALLQQAQARLNQQSYGGDITEYCWGGGLPGGANEMKRMDYGGYMDMGGYNSPTNYGSFSVPMAEGGYYEPGGDVGLVGWAAKEQQKLEQRLQTGIPSDVKKYYGPYKEPRKFDSTHVFPGDPNIAIGFKGNKVMLISKDGDADNIVRKVNKDRTYVGPTIKGERDIYFDYLHPHEYGGILDASNNQDYPMMEEGGRANLMKIIKAASKKMKKEYATGGKVTMQGGNQNQLDNMNNYFKSFIQQNASNAFVEEEEKSFRMGGIPMAVGGWELSPEYRNSEKRSQVIKALENKKKIAINQNLSDDQLLDMARKEGIIVDTPDNQSQSTTQNTPSIASMFKQLAQDFGPQSRTQGYTNFPANFRSYWQMNKAGKESINSLPDNFQLGNLKVSPEYDVLGRTWIGKKLGWGPKRINFELSGTSQYKNTPYQQGPQVKLADPNNPLFKPYSQYNTGAPEGTLQTEKGSFAPLDFNIGKQQGPMAYGGLYKAQPGVSTPISMGQGVSLTGTAPGGTSLNSLYSLPVASSISTPANVEQMKKQAGRETEQLYKTEMQGDTGTTNVSAKASFERDNSGLLEAVGQHAVPGINMLAGVIEAPGQKEAEEKALLAARTPGSDTSFVAVNPGDTPDIGDYDQWGKFRANRKVAGPMYGEYGGMFEQGGFYEEGEEYDLSPEQMEYLRSQGYDFDILEDID
jgi:hypothetical protein